VCVSEAEIGIPEQSSHSFKTFISFVHLIEQITNKMISASFVRVSLIASVAAALSAVSSAWVVAPTLSTRSLLQKQSARHALSRSILKAADEDTGVEEIRRNPDRPELPELKGDFDWDEKFGSDADWITENVPGKIVMNQVDLAKQVAALEKLEEKWRYEREVKEYEESKQVGFVAKAEILNGRAAMFFLVTGLLTELWTGVTIPGQVEEMLRIGGFIGFE